MLLPDRARHAAGPDGAAPPAHRALRAARRPRLVGGPDRRHLRRARGRRHPPDDRARRPRLPRLDARAAVPVLARQRRPLPGRRRAGARAGLPDRLPPRDRLRRRPAGHRGRPRRRPRLLVPLARGPLAGRGARPAHGRRLERRLERVSSARRRARPAFRRRSRPPTRGSEPHISESICKAMGRFPSTGGTSRARFARAFAAHCSPGRSSRRRRPAPARARRRPRRSARVVRTAQRAVPLAARPRTPAATTCASPATGASARACRRCTCAPPGPAPARCPGAGTGRCAPRASLNSRWSNIAQIVAPRGDVYPPTRPSALRVTAVAPDSVTVMFGAAEDDRGVARYELLGGGKVLARGAAAPLTAHGLPCATRFTLRVRALDAAGHVSPPSPVAHARDARRAPTSCRPTRRRTCARSRSPTRASRWPGTPRTTPTARSAATPSTATACCSACRSSTGLPRPQPRARHAVPLHGRGDRRRQPPLARQRARHDHAGPAPRHRARLRLHARHDEPELRGPAAPLPADLDRLADLLPPRARPLDPGPGRPARDRLGAPARHRRRAARRDPGPGDRCTRCSRAPPTATTSIDAHLGARREYGYDGVNIDFEAGAADRSPASRHSRASSRRRCTPRAPS